MIPESYPKGRNSLNATAHIYHKIPYAGVFEEGATIRGRPRLWIALPSTPQRYGRKPMTPELFAKSIGSLSFVKRPGKRPLLVAKAKKGKNMSKVTSVYDSYDGGGGGGGSGPSNMHILDETTRRTHVVRVYNPNNQNIWVDVEVIDSLEMVGMSGIYMWNFSNPA